MSLARVNGVSLFYEFHGPEDGELLILNNGVFMNTTSWPQLPELSRRYRVLAYDMRGQGQSEHPAGEYSLDLHADDLVALMDALRLEKAHMVGTSYGGELNLVMGIRHPERCRTLVIIASVPRNSDPILMAMIERWRLAAGLGDGPLFFRLIYADTYSEKFLVDRPDLIPFAEERYARLDLPAAIRLLESCQRFDVTADLDRIKVPTCIASAELDILKPRRYGEIMHEAIAGSEFHLIPGSGHVAVLEKAAEVSTIILGFLAKHAA
jgi:3-oxoadipate enol-lactonase